jgi:high-affinity iron transporter
VSGAVPPDSWYGTLLKGTVNFSPATTVLEAIVWLAYIVPVGVLFFRPTGAPASTGGTRTPASSSAAPASGSAAPASGAAAPASGAAVPGGTRAASAS